VFSLITRFYRKTAGDAGEIGFPPPVARVHSQGVVVWCKTEAVDLAPRQRTHLISDVTFVAVDETHVQLFSLLVKGVSFFDADYK
jgi:hypothetical protein